VAVGALLGIKPVGSNAEHVIALDADAVNTGLMTAPGWTGLFKPPAGGAAIFSGLLSTDMNGF